MIAKVMSENDILKLQSMTGLGVVVHQTMSEYNALTTAEKNDGNVHLVLEEEPINANIVEYTDGKTVKDELDDIAEKTGNTDISAIGDGTTTGAIDSLNTDLTELLYKGPYITYTVSFNNQRSADIEQPSVPAVTGYTFVGFVGFYVLDADTFPISISKDEIYLSRRDGNAYTGNVTVRAYPLYAKSNSIS